MSSKKSISIEKWKLPNGNVCFRFRGRDTICNLGISWREEMLFDKTVHEIMDELVALDVEEAGLSVVKTKVQIDTKGTYGLIVGRFFLALINDGSVWEYPISFHTGHDDESEYYECGRVYSVSTSPKHIRAIESRWKRIISSLALSDTTKMALLLLVILLVGGLLFFLFSWLIQKLKWWWLLLIVVAYIALLSLTCWISSRTSKSFWRIINDVVMAPMGVVYLVVGLIQPFIVIAGTYFFVSFYAFGIPTLALFGLDKLCGWDLHSSTIAFIVMSLGSIICAHSYSITKKIIHHSFLRNWRNHKYEAYREDLAVYLIHPRNVIFILYLLYFIFLIISGYLQIQSDSYLVSKDFDAAVLKAFLVFIAFTNMKIKAQEADLDVKDLLRRTLLLFVHDEDEGKVKGETGE